MLNKNDFDLEENTPEETNVNNENVNQENNVYSYDYGENSDFSEIGLSQKNDFIEDTNVVYEDQKLDTPQEKFNFLLSTLNKKVLIIGGIALFVILFIIILIIISTARTNASYKSDIEVSNIIYMGETASLKVKANGKKGLEKTVTTFEANNDKVTLLQEKLKGQEVENTIIPIGEGKTTIRIKSKLDKRTLTDTEKELIICPAFNTNLIQTGKISVVKETSFKPYINFGLGECSTGITYESSNENIMKVSKNGTVTGVKEGSAVLTVTKEERSFAIPVYVTKNSEEMTDIKSTVKSIQLLEGKNRRIQLLIAPQKATSNEIEFISDDEEVVTVDQAGLVEAKKAGKATIEIRMSGLRMTSVSITVLKDNSKTGVEATDLKLDVSQLILVQGDSKKILSTLVPANTKNKNLTYTSENEEVATVTKTGVIYALGKGKTRISVSTSNNITKTIEVTVYSLKTPIITPSDKIESGKWHNKAFTLKLTNADKGSAYYYGTNPNKLDKKGSVITLKQDEKNTYFIKACKQSICTETSSYDVLIDVTKPEITTIAGIENTLVSEDEVQIVAKDKTSLVNKWCVTTENTSSKCKWNNIASTSNKVINYVATKNGIYFAFVKDVAGNISNSKSFEITHIK